MDTVICKEVIVSTIRRRGEGVTSSPIRIITEVFEKDGKLIAEYDPCSNKFSPEDMIDFCNSFWEQKLKNNQSIEDGYLKSNQLADAGHLKNWLNESKIKSLSFNNPTH